MLALCDCQELRRCMTRTATRALLRDAGGKSRSLERMPGTEIRRVLVCRPNHRLGNLLLLTPLLQELQRTFPHAEVGMVLAGDDGVRLFRTFGSVRHIHTLSRRMVRHPLQTVRIALQLRHAKYDLVIDPCEGSQSSRWFVATANAAYAIHATAGNAAGAERDREEAVQAAPRHMAKRSVFLLRWALTPYAAWSDDDYPTLDLRLSLIEQQRGEQILYVLTAARTQLPRVLGIFADARGDKRYTQAWWIRFIDALCTRAPGIRIIESVKWLPSSPAWPVSSVPIAVRCIWRVQRGCPRSGCFRSPTSASTHLTAMAAMPSIPAAKVRRMSPGLLP